MKKDIKDRWVTALRSGEYEQTKGYLKADGGFCCLGVLCDILREDVSGSWESNGNEYDLFKIEDETVSTAVLPYEVVTFADLNDENPTIKMADGFQISLAEMNDRGDTFTEIANVIEERL